MNLDNLQSMLTKSAYLITIDPSQEFDDKIVFETGMAVLMNKPMMVIVPAGREPNKGLERYANIVIYLDADVDDPRSQAKILDGVTRLRSMFPDG